MMQKLGEQLRLFHFSYRSNVSMKPLFLAIFSDNAIVKEHSMTKDKVSYYINYEIASLRWDVVNKYEVVAYMPW